MANKYQSTKSGRQIDASVTYTEKLPNIIESIQYDISKLNNNKADSNIVPQKLSDLINDITDQTYNSSSEKPQSGTAVAEAIANLLGTAPENLDTLEELAKALNEDENFAAKVIAELTNKVDKVDGKGLSTNDFTDVDKEKLDGVEEGANKTTVDSELLETSTNPVQNKVVLEALNEKAGSIINSVSGESIQLTDSANEKLRGLKVYGRTNQVKTTGKNLIPYPYEYTNTDTNLTVTDNGDGTITINGTTTRERYLYLKRRFVLPKGVTMTFSGCHKEGASWETQVMSLEHKTSSGATLFTTIIGSIDKSFTIDDDSDYGYTIAYIHLGAGTVCNNFIFKPQIEIGEVATKYEPYSGGVASPSPNWAQPLDNVNAEISITDGCEQSSNFIVSNELAGIKVGSNGNYTDSNGQQRVCDEVDCARGKYVQRIFVYITKGEEQSVSNPVYNNGIVRWNIPISLQAIEKEGISSHFVNTNNWSDITDGKPNCFYVYTKYIAFTAKAEDIGVKGTEVKETDIKAWLKNNKVIIYYRLSEPIERDLTEEEIATYKTLQTYKPTTIISNNENAYMKVDYVADTKSYIDNKFAELQQAIISTGGNV